jgi:serine/threonine protein phosphatase PrpC
VGEDAYFIRDTALGVADGVGGWYDEPSKLFFLFLDLFLRPTKITGADAMLYARRIMHLSSETMAKVEQDPKKFEVENGPGSASSPVKIMGQGFARFQEEIQKSKIQGSTTALMALLDVRRLRGSGSVKKTADSFSKQADQLKIVNVGDCGVMIVRDRVKLFKTKELVYRSNCPYQLGTDSDVEPRHGDEYTVDVQEGDVVIVASDGLWDNLFVSLFCQRWIYMKFPHQSNNCQY